MFDTAILPRVKVYNMNSLRSDRPVPNQFIIDTDDGTYFQSYKSVIAYKSNDGKIYLDESRWNWSRTTGKYRNEFLEEGIEETRKKIKDGIYTLVDLN